MIIYKVTNLTNNKIYIGKTKNLSYRKYTHKCQALTRDSNTYFHKAIRKYGWENFKWEVIDETETDEELNEKESYWIEKYNSNIQTVGYNMSNGGEGNALIGELNPMYGKSHSDETKRKMSEKMKGKTHSSEAKKKIGEAKQGENHPLSVLTEDDVREIKKMLNNGCKQKEIMEKFNIKQPTVSAIKTGRIWSHIE
ncbi:homing endonuclease [Bacillus phage Izhevsk]|uniref:GIY-YIG endonuclease n=1 Tax=Bacillus phage Izhevsk TaxID=2724322 RepID=A0A6H0X6F7_9CAUD|nr:homing endonuclease [Bacillus phage Izhevsk]QIW89883.1 GIY-YIG endonuclease [Bacillus phage Izhevsk]